MFLRLDQILTTESVEREVSARNVSEIARTRHVGTTALLTRITARTAAAAAAAAAGFGAQGWQAWRSQPRAAVVEREMP